MSMRLLPDAHAFLRWLSGSRRLSGAARRATEQKMLLLSRALVARPRIMLIDETSEGLQPTVLRRMAEVLTEIRERLGVSILLIEQNLPFALSVADRYALLNLGEVVESGEVGEPGLADTLSEHLKV